MYQETDQVRRRFKKPKVIKFDDTTTRKEKISNEVDFETMFFLFLFLNR